MIKEILKELKLNKTTLYNIFLCIISYFGIILYYGISNTLGFSIFFLLGYIALLVFFLKGKINIKKVDKKFSIVLGLLITIILVVGKMVNNVILDDVQIIFTLKNIVISIIEIICIFPLIYRLLNYFYYYFTKINLISNNKRKNINKFFITSWIIIFIFYFIYFIVYFPGKLTYDSNLQIEWIKNGIFSDWHPFLHTQLVSLFYNIGNNIFHSENIGIAIYILFQMIIMSLLFAYVCRYLYKKQIDIRICLFVLICYAILPQYTHYSITLWKDVLFGGAFVLILISLIEFSNNKFNKSQIILFTLGLLMMLFFRNNGIYIVLFMIPFILYTFRKKIRIFLPLMLSIVTIYFIVKGPIYNFIGVVKTNSVEALSIPLQQISRVISLEKDIDEKDLKYLNSIIDTSKIKENYTPYISDPIKNMIDRNRVEKTKSELISVWSKLLVKYPQIYVEAYLSQTLGYWYTDVDYWVTSNSNQKDNIVYKVFDLTASNNIPFSNLCWSIGLGFIITLLSFTLSICRKNKKSICYIPFLGLWLTMMIASPVFAEYRYVYGLFTCMPLIILVPFLNSKISVNKNNIL